MSPFQVNQTSVLMACAALPRKAQVYIFVLNECQEKKANSHKKLVEIRGDRKDFSEEAMIEMSSARGFEFGRPGRRQEMLDRIQSQRKSKRQY